MRILFYKIDNISKKINKRLPDAPALTLDGTLKENCDMLNPVILINHTGVPDYNFCHIPDFERYYFIAPPTNVGAVLWELHMHVDVLYTWRQGILTAPCIVAKSSSNYNLYLNDNNYKCYQNPLTFSYNFPSGFDISNAKFVMTLFGDKVTVT